MLLTCGEWDEKTGSVNEHAESTWAECDYPPELIQPQVRNIVSKQARVLLYNIALKQVQSGTVERITVTKMTMV